MLRRPVAVAVTASTCRRVEYGGGTRTHRISFRHESFCTHHFFWKPQAHFTGVN